jgi:hypothetical protein
MKKHLAILTKKGAQRILSGQKTVETRFSKRKIDPFGKVNVGDTVYLKESGKKDVVGQFIVKKIISFESLDQQDWDFIKTHYGQALSLGDPQSDETFFKSHESANFGTIIFIGEVEQLITSPITFKKRDLRGWVVLE